MKIWSIPIMAQIEVNYRMPNLTEQNQDRFIES
jgi:hypothetical protein